PAWGEVSLLAFAGSCSMSVSWPMSTTVSGALGPCGSEFVKSQWRKNSSACSSRGSRTKRIPSSKTTNISQRVDRCIAAEVKREKCRVTSGKKFAFKDKLSFNLVRPMSSRDYERYHD